jgi:hypothetical protein
MAISSLYINRWSAAMPQPNDLSRSLVALDQNSTIIAVVEMSQSSWLVGGVLPDIERQPRKKLEPSPERLLALLHRWRDESVRAGRTITRIAVAFEAGRDGFWLARWLEARGVEAHVIHPSSVAPDTITATLRQHAPGAVRVGLETGQLSNWLTLSLRRRGVPVVCMDARHARLRFVDHFVCHFSLSIIRIPRGCKPSGRHGLPLLSLTRVYSEVDPDRVNCQKPM